MKKVGVRGLAMGLAAVVGAPSAAAVVIGQIDDFEDGTVQGWHVSALGSPHPAPPQNVASGGPQGVDDNYMLLTAVGGVTAGSRMAVLSGAQWSGNYVDAGVSSIRMWARNQGNTDMVIRLLFERLVGGAPTDLAASTTGVSLAAGSGWQSIELGTAAADFTALAGTVDMALTNTSLIRIFHGTSTAFPPVPITGQLGIDDVQAVPEPSTLMAACAGLAAMLRRRRMSA